MAKCPRYVQPIGVSENIGDSLVKINNNFYNLKTGLCDLQKQIDNTVQVRTFFYYGPNSESDSTSGMQDNVESRPSNNTIESFVNDTNQLNVPSISKLNDVVFVIYQKTGYLTQNATRITSGSITVTGTQATYNAKGKPRGTTTVVRNLGWSTTTPDRYNIFSPVFIIWKLVFNGSGYITDSGFPKFSQAETISTPNWNNPRLWDKY